MVERAALISTLSPRMTTARRAVIEEVTGTRGEDGVPEKDAVVYWVADLLLAVVPEYPEGVIGAVCFFKEALREVPTSTWVKAISVVDGWHVQVSGTRGGYDLEANRPYDLALVHDSWLSTRTYNLLAVVEARKAEVQAWQTRQQRKSGKTPTAPPRP